MLVCYFSLECVPSQNGLLADSLQPHQATFLGASILAIKGLLPVFFREWGPSQKGCFADSPQAHQWYSPGCMSITNGAFCFVLIWVSYLKYSGSLPGFHLNERRTYATKGSVKSAARIYPEEIPKNRREISSKIIGFVARLPFNIAPHAWFLIRAGGLSR